MRKLYKLSEKDLERIIKRVISEQKTVDSYIPKDFPKEIEKIEINSKPLELKLNLKSIETPESFFQKLNNSNIKFTPFHLELEGYKFPVYPLSIGNDNYKLSFDGLGDMKTVLLTIKKEF